MQLASISDDYMRTTDIEPARAAAYGDHYENGPSMYEEIRDVQAKPEHKNIYYDDTQLIDSPYVKLPK